jgi:P4 family phage/plasmid primase-like protien
LQKHCIKKNAINPNPITNTRIGDKNLNIYGGSYHIPENEYESPFLELYYKEIIQGNTPEYLTEKQRENDGCIAVDIDLRYEYEIKDRMYSKEHVEDLRDMYLDELKKIYQMNDDTEIPVYIFQKPNVNRIADKKITKDGVHLIFGIQADRIVQRILRARVMEKTKEAWADLPIINTWDDVFDEGITAGTTNWQLFGSQKPANEKYELTRIFAAKFDSADSEFSVTEIPLTKFDIEKNMYRLSVRFPNHISLFIKNSFATEYEEVKNADCGGGGARISRPPLFQSSNENTTMVSAIKTREELDFMLNNFLENLPPVDYELKETYIYANILPPNYYEEGSYTKWIRVLWVLKNTSSRLLIVWIAFCAKAKNFQFSSIPELCERWNSTDLRQHNGLTKRSLLNWVKTDAKEQYEKVRKDTIGWYIEETIRKTNRECGDWDLANVLYQMHKDRFVCVSVKAGIWYEYKNHRWHENDSGTTLRKSISTEMRNLYIEQADKFREQTSATTVLLAEVAEPGAPKPDETKKSRANDVINISLRLAKTTDKKNIMIESKELFYDGTFLSKLDMNPYLLCFKNGVIDFKEKIFRNGNPEDNISICTNINYIKIDEANPAIVAEINDFMDKLFPERELCEYMWEHLASSLIGTSSNQTFNIYIGIGQNGKSVLVNLMEKVLGDYKGDVPLTLVTEKRGKVGGLAPEIVQLKGKRYAVMQEPSKGDRINEGIMKQLTSGKDPIQGRAPYMPQTISFIPQFNLVVTANVFMEIKSNDHGTWRRIRAVPFKSLFTENPVAGDPEKPYQFKLDKHIDEKFDQWKEVFASMLVERVFITGGIVKDCEIVLSKSNEYRKSQDYMSEFIHDRIVREKGSYIGKTELNNEFMLWYTSNHGGKGPAPRDLHEFMDREFGKQKESVWVGIKIKYEKPKQRDFGDDNTTVDGLEDDIYLE